MSTILMASVPIFGHVSPMARLATDLCERGHRVRFITGRRFADLVESTGAEFVPLPQDADFDDRTVNDDLSEAQRPGGVAGLRYDVAHVFLRPAKAQLEALRAAIESDTEAVVVDPTFVGAALLAATPPEDRPPVIVAGVLPLPLSSDDTPPFGLGLSPGARVGTVERIRNRLLRMLVERAVFGRVQRDYDTLFRTIAGRAAPGFVMSWMSHADAIVQFSIPAFEYPRRDAPVPITYAGPIIRAGGGSVPSWWSDLDSDRPVVLVTQGTIANRKLDELILPTIEAFADSEVLLVVTSGGRPVAELGELPPNVRAAEFLPYDELFPHVDLFITNGGYGGVHYALASGVPMVVAGAGEDKPEVAARVAWSSVGLNLKTGRPRPATIARAARTVLEDPSYRAAATAAAQQIATTDGVATLLAAITALRTPSGPRRGSDG